MGRKMGTIGDFPILAAAESPRIVSLGNHDALVIMSTMQLW